MSPELLSTIEGVQHTLVQIMEHLSIFNYGAASIEIRQLYAKLAVQSALLNANLDDMEPQLNIDCINIEED